VSTSEGGHCRGEIQSGLLYRSSNAKNRNLYKSQMILSSVIQPAEGFWHEVSLTAVDGMGIGIALGDWSSGSHVSRMIVLAVFTSHGQDHSDDGRNRNY